MQTNPVGAARPSPWLENALIGFLCLIWGSTWLVIREGLDDLPPLGSLALRFWVAFAVFAAIAPQLRRIEGGAPPPRSLVLLMGCANFAASYSIIYWAEQSVPSGLTSVLWAVFPILVAIAGHFLLPGERLGRTRALGFALGFAGVVLLFFADLRAISTDAVRAGAVLLLSPVISAFGNVTVKRQGAGVSSALLCRNSLGLAAVLVSAAALLVEREAKLALTPRAIFSVAYLGVAGTVVTFAIYFWLLRHAPASKLSLIAYVTPAVALCLGWAVRGEAIAPTTLAGAALIVFGVALAGRRRA